MDCGGKLSETQSCSLLTDFSMRAEAHSQMLSLAVFESGCFSDGMGYAGREVAAC